MILGCAFQGQKGGFKLSIVGAPHCRYGYWEGSNFMPFINPPQLITA